MNDRDRELLKDRLRVIGQDQGIRLDTPEHWVIDGIKDPGLLFEHVSLIMEPPSVLYFEGTTIHPEAAAFFLKHATAHLTTVACDTVFPVPDVYHIGLSPEAVIGIAELVSQRPTKELFDHVKGYRHGRVIFTFHDAFEGRFLIADSIPEAKIKAFCEVLRVSYTREQTMRAGGDALRSLLNAIGNPDKVQMPRVTWWRRIADEFMAGFREK